MKPEAQRIAIAEVCGWTIIDFTIETKIPECIPPKTTYWDPARKYKPHPGIPDYLNDLNAMHEAETFLEDGTRQRPLWKAYTQLLSKLCDDNLGLIVHATATQRAEAFLRTLNLWTPS